MEMRHSLGSRAHVEQVRRLYGPPKWIVGPRLYEGERYFTWTYDISPWYAYPSNAYVVVCDDHVVFPLAQE